MTDHADDFDEPKLADYVRECAELSDGQFSFIPGLEYTCEQHMHILGYGVTVLADTMDPQRIIQHIEQHGGLAVIAHPKDTMFSWIETFDVLPFGIETWNSKYDGRYAPRSPHVRIVAPAAAAASRKCERSTDKICIGRNNFAACLLNCNATALNREAILKALVRVANIAA